MPLYPNRLPPDSEITPSEKEIFKKAKQSKLLARDNTYLFHSLNLQKAGNKLKGEVDFIYLDQEFILFFEVKGGIVKYVADKNEWWTMGGTLKKDPFKQAYKSLFEIRDNVLPLEFPNDYYHQKLKLGYGVLFPDSSRPKNFEDYTKKYSGETIEYDLDLVYLSEDHNKEYAFDIYLQRIKKYWNNFPKYKNHYNGIDNSDVEKIKNYFRTDLIFKTPLLSYIQEDKEQTKFYTDQQKKVLNQIIANPKHGAIIDGGPGTGKTLIALERTAQLANSGNNVLFLCYNKNLCSYLQERYKKAFPYDQTGSVTIQSFHKLLVNTLKELGVEEETKNTHEYYSKELPLKFRKYITSNQMVDLFDHVVIDEGQDLFHQHYIDCIELFLKNGWDSNEWTIFIDSKYQTIYQDFDKKLFNTFKEIYDAYYYQLFENCRNTEQIINTAHLHTGFDKIPCMKNSKLDPTINKYKSDRDLIVKLNKEIKELTENNIPENWITILGSNQHQNLIIENDPDTYYKLNDYKSINKKNAISTSTPHSFKGLENEVIIYIAKDNFRKNDKEVLKEYYTAYTRAKSNLIIFLPDSIISDLDQFVLENLNLNN